MVLQAADDRFQRTLQAEATAPVHALHAASYLGLHIRMFTSLCSISAQRGIKICSSAKRNPEPRMTVLAKPTAIYQTEQLTLLTGSFLTFYVSNTFRP
jgi:hypothetical protein